MGFIASFFARSVFGISYKALGIVIFLSAILAYRFYLIHELQVARNDKQEVLQQLADYKAAIKAETATRLAENARNEADSKKAMLEIAIQRDEALKKVGLEKTTIAQLRKDLENEKSNIVNALNDNYQLRVSSAVSSVTSASKVSETTSRPTQSTSDLNRTITALVRSCAETTIEYNSLWESWDRNCKIYGCE